MTRRSRITVGVALSGALVVAAACLALSYARQERREAVEAWRLRLIAMADDRADAVGQWVAVGRRAAQSLAARGVVRQALASSVQAPRTAGDRKELAGSVQAELDTFARTEGYRSAYLVTEAGTVLAASAGSLAFDDTCLSAARGVLAGGEGIPKFHLHANESPLVGFAAAVASDGVPQHGAAHPAIRGAVVLESDPYAWLYPMLAREPTHTATGETVLLGRQGTDIVFLTPPRRAGAWPVGRRIRTDPAMIAAPEAVPDLRKWIATTRSKDGIVGEHLHRRQDGSTFPVEASVRLVELGSERFYLAIIRDISDRRRAEDALRQSEERYRTLA